MAEILGRVTGGVEVPRGADVSLRILVPERWVLEGASIEVEIPRNLTCAACQGGGCSKCKNSGAITLRARDELLESVQVALPDSSLVSVESSALSVNWHNVANPTAATRPRRPLTIRIPECGGLPEPGSGTNLRGWLLLEVTVGERESSNVRLLDDEQPLSSTKVQRTVARRDELAESANDGSDKVKRVKGTSGRPARRSDKPVVVRAESRAARMGRGSRLGRLRAFGLGPSVRWSAVVVVVAVTLIWLWYWR